MAKQFKNIEAGKLASIEEELRVLKTQIRRRSVITSERKLKDLEGIWKGVTFTFEEISKAKLVTPEI